jgi:hypothetical protein
MEKVQSKLKECVEKQTMSVESLERLSNALQTTTAEDEQNMVTDNSNNDSTVQLSEELLAAKELKGENKVPVVHKKSKKNKHSVKSANKKEPKEKRRPRYFVQF